MLKIIAIFIIVINHITQALQNNASSINTDEFVIDLSMATLNMQQLTLSLLRYFGALGNNVFFVASAWFLLESDKWSKKKELSLAMNAWGVSVIILAVMEIMQVKVSGILVIKLLFPNILGNNWYITCYLLFYPIHGLLNKLINQIGQKSLLRICLASGVLYIGINFLKSGMLFSSALIEWVAIYFIIAYGKRYLPQLMNSKKANLSFLIIGLVANILLVVMTNFLGINISFFSDKLLYWNVSINPFLVLATIGVFNLARQYTFHNKVINYISGLSLLIYVIHENTLTYCYLRPAIWQWIYENLGYSKIVLWALMFSLVFFVIAAILAAIYKATIGKLILKLRDVIYDVAKKAYGKLERKILALK